MKKANIIPLLAALFFALNLPAQQPVMLKLPDMTVEPGSNFHLQVQVENFIDVTGLQFSVTWDPTVLNFLNVGNFGLPLLTVDGNFGLMESQDGELRFSWYQSELTGLTLNDMSTIFSIGFKAIGAPNATCQVMIADEPIIIEVVGTDGVLPHVVDNGMITVEGPNFTNETVTQDFTLFQNSPNPFRDVTYIEFSFAANTSARLRIFDQTGKTIWQQKQNFNAGLHKIPVSRDLFQSAGSYFYTLETEKAIATRQLIAQ